MEQEKTYTQTRAVCPRCRKIVDTSVVEKNGNIFLKKDCKDHGISYALTCSDPNWYRESTKYVKPGQLPLGLSVGEFKGCPDSCGLCPEHKQHTCLPVIEILSGCNMDCPICLKEFNDPFQMTSEEYRNVLRRLNEYEKDLKVINLSGGEPTLHPQFEEFLRISKEENITQVSVSTNGVRLLEDEHLRQLFKETGTIVSLQFDGFMPETYVQLRGLDLSEKKMEIIKVLEESDIRYSLVATVVKGINDGEITDITDFFFRSKAITLMFQPATFTGKADSEDFDPDKHRITIPDVVKEIEKNEHVKPGDFNPVPCSHYSCFAVSYYLIIDEGKYLSLKEFLGEEKCIDLHTNRAFLGLEQDGFSAMKEGIFNFWSASDSCGCNERVLHRIHDIVNKLNLECCTSKGAYDLGIRYMKNIFIHQFMDVHTLDFDRLVKCCNHYALGDGRIIPMCAQNVFFQ